MKITGDMHFAKALQDLEQRGVDVRAVSPGELYALAEACRRCANPFSEVNAELAEEPVRLSRGVWLWPPTAGALVWLKECAEQWWPRGSWRWRWAQVYALRHARERGAFAGLDSRWAAWRAVVRCALTMPVHGAELADGIARCYGVAAGVIGGRDGARPSQGGGRDGARPSQDGGAGTDFTALVARLEAVSGIPMDAWLWDRSFSYTLKAYSEMHAFAAAFAQGRRERARMRDELDEALTALARAKAAIVRRVEGSAGREDQEDGGDGGGDDRKADREVAAGEAAGGRSVALDEHSAGQAEEEGVVGAGGSGGGVGIVHDGADCSTTGGPDQ